MKTFWLFWTFPESASQQKDQIELDHYGLLWGWAILV